MSSRHRRTTSLRTEAKRPHTHRMVSHLCHGQMDVVPHGMSQLLTPLQASYLSLTSSCAAAPRKEGKYSDSGILQHLSFPPLAFEAFGPINQAVCGFLSSSDLGCTLVLDDPQESSFIFSICLFLLSASIQFVSVSHSGTCRRKFLTNRDAPRF